MDFLRSKSVLDLYPGVGNVIVIDSKLLVPESIQVLRDYDFLSAPVVRVDVSGEVHTLGLGISCSKCSF
jgi:hypothetical protein